MLNIKIDNRCWTWEEIGRNPPYHFGIKIIIVLAVYKTEGDKDETHESLKDDELEAGKKKEYFMWIDENDLWPHNQLIA